MALERTSCIQTLWQWIGDNPLKCLWLYMAFSMVAWTIQCTLLQTILPLDVLETINWGAQWALGHYKHPPLSGWLGYLFSCLSGHHDWSMYLLAQLCLVTGVYFTYKLAREFFDETTAAAAALVLYIVDYYTPSPMKYCSHFVQSAVQPVMAWLFYLAVRDNKWQQWCWFGAVSAIGVLGKYSAGMLLVALLVCMVCTSTGRRRFLSLGPYLSFVVFLVLMAPHLVWLYQNDFCCIRHLDHRVEAAAHSFWYGFGVLGYALYPYLIEAAVLLLALWKTRMLTRRPIHREALLWSTLTCWIPSLMLVGIAFMGKSVVCMWFSSMISWSGIMLLALMPWSFGRDAFRRLVLLIFGYTLIVLVATTIDLMVKPRSKLHTEPQVLVQMATEFWKEGNTGEVPCLIGYRWLANAVENYAPHRPPSADLEDIVSIRRLEPVMKQRGVLLIGENDEAYADFLKAYYPNVQGRKAIRSFSYRSLSGREDTDEVFLMALPPLK